MSRNETSELDRKTRPSKGKIYTLAVILVLAPLAVSFVAFTLVDIKDSQDLRKDQLKAIGEMLGNNVVALLHFDDPEGATSLLTSLSSQPSIQACVYNASGKPFATYPAALDLEKAQMPLEAPKDTLSKIADSKLNMTLPIRSHDGKHFLGTIYLREDLGDVYNKILDRLLLQFVILLAAVSVALLVAGRLHKRLA
ncbi:MAG: CHASE sensor domain-containing protein [Planctomycetia bacterium]|jgi:hypothetical protein